MNAQDSGGNVLLVNTNDGRYTRYFTVLDRAIGTLNAWTQYYSGGALHGAAAVHYLTGLQASFGVLRSRFTFDTNDSFMVDLSDSGYPHSYMLSRLRADRRDQPNGDALGVEKLKRVFLDDLFKTGSSNHALLNAIAHANYASVLAKMDGSFDPECMCGVPEPHDSAAGLYRTWWAMYDGLMNIPTLFGMVFAYKGSEPERDFVSLARVLRYESQAGISVSILAHNIDTAVDRVTPLFVSRATLGPLYLPDFTLGDGPWQRLLTEHMLPNQFLAEVTIDHTHSVEARRPSALAVKFGVSPAERQVYAVNTSDKLSHERGAARVERILILPHRTLQAMRATNDERLGTVIPVPYGKEGELL